MKRKYFYILTLFLVGLCTVVHCQNDSVLDESVSQTDPLPTDLVVPVFEDISVHDPSVIRVEDEFYIFGSHLSAAKSKDLMAWERVADIVTVNNPLFEDVFDELAETFEWAQTNTLWAADVTQLKDGRFYFYYNACKGDSPRSAMGVAVSEQVEGPYENLGIILKSGMWGLPSEDGTVYDASKHPNAVDPHVFYDNEGKLWMIYGSYSGGIYILEMDEETGFPLEDQGYGKHLMGNNHQRIEGAYVLYSPHSEYYYLFVSFGGLGQMDGYNVRVFRSITPNGPYLDSEGQDLEAVSTNIIFDDDVIEPVGVKIIGNYYYSGSVPSVGYMSPGHNSAYYDEATGQYFLLFHTRFLNSGGYHSVRVHEMAMNADGWPVVSPLRYAPRITYEEQAQALIDEETEEAEETGDLSPEDSEVNEPEENDEPVNGEGGEVVDPESEEPEVILPPTYLDAIDPLDVPGIYHFLSFEKEISSKISYSGSIVLQEDGSIAGDQSGTWEFDEETNYILIDLGERREVEETEPVSDSETDEPTADPTETPTEDPAEDTAEEEVLDPSIVYYKGVVSKQWNEMASAFCISFSALSDDGRPIWGVQQQLASSY